jgi:hypothetical protein
MGINFTEALATLSRALTVVLFRAVIFVVSGFMVIILFGMSFFAFRLAGGASPIAVIIVTMLSILGWWLCGRVLQRFFLYHHRAAMLLLFSGCSLPAPGLATTLNEAGRYFNNYSQWQSLNRWLRQVMISIYRSSGQLFEGLDLPRQAGIGKRIDILATGPISQAVLALAFSRGGGNIQQSANEGLALYFRHGNESRRLARQWLMFSAIGLAFLFICLALPNWFFFRNAGVPVEIGIVLAAAIAWLLYQAFVIPFVLAGVSSALLAETRGKTPDPGLCKKLDSLIADTALPGKERINSAPASTHW